MAKVTGTEGDDTLAGTTGSDNIYGYGGSDTLTGDASADNLYGGDGADSLFGGDGADNMDGGLGADFLAGGLGDDTYVVDDVNDVVQEAGGEGNDTVKSFLTEYRLAANVENLVLALSGNQNGRGNDLGNKIKGNDFVNQVFGLGGDDVIFTYGGNDLINPGTGDDAIDGGAGIDLVTFKVGATHGVSVDLAASDFSGPGHVVYDYGGGVTDTLIVRNVENLEGTQFNDELLGDAGANKILGGAGDDVFRGRAGNDDMTGGAGNDVFIFEAAGAANGQDVVREFVSGEDTLRFFAADGYSPAATLTYGNAPVGAGPQFVFNGSHELFYDADGAGGAAMVKIASVLGGTPTLGDIQVI